MYTTGVYLGHPVKPNFGFLRLSSYICPKKGVGGEGGGPKLILSSMSLSSCFVKSLKLSRNLNNLRISARSSMAPFERVPQLVYQFDEPGAQIIGKTLQRLSGAALLDKSRVEGGGSPVVMTLVIRTSPRVS